MKGKNRHLKWIENKLKKRNSEDNIQTEKEAMKTAIVHAVNMTSNKSKKESNEARILRKQNAKYRKSIHN